MEAGERGQVKKEWERRRTVKHRETGNEKKKDEGGKEGIPII